MQAAQLNVINGNDEMESSATGEKMHELASCVKSIFTAYDLRRLASFAAQIVDHHTITDLLSDLSRLYFTPAQTPLSAKIQEDIKLTGIQAAILLGCGLQSKSLKRLSGEFGLPMGQLVSTLIKVMRKFSDLFTEVREAVAVPPATETMAVEQGENQQGDVSSHPANLDRYTIPEDAQLPNISVATPSRTPETLVGETKSVSSKKRKRRQDDSS